MEEGECTACGSEKPRGGFTSRLGFVLATAGCAVGLGNLWRFPYLADKYGGGTFLFVYIVLVAIFGITLMLGEVALGRKTGKSCVDAFRVFSEKHSWIGVMAAIVPMVIASYYCVIGGWVLKYFFEFSLFNGLEVAAPGYFDQFISGAAGTVLGSPVFWFLLFSLITVIVVVFGVEKGIEKLSKTLIPILLVIMVVIVVYVFTLPPGENGITVLDGLKHYLIPDFDEMSMSTVLGASSQLFYSLSIGSGVLITYGSYMSKKHDMLKSVKQVVTIDVSVAFMAGLMILPAVYMFGIGGGEQGPGLMFVSMPMIFQEMPAGQIIGLLFFFLVAIAAITSSISMAEAVVSSLRDRLRWDRKRASLVVMAIIMFLGMFSCLGYGPLDWVNVGGHCLLELFDLFSNNLLMPVVSLLTCLFIGYVLKPKTIIDEVEGSGEFRSARIYTFLVKYLCPLFLGLIFVMGIAGIFGYMNI